METVLAAQSPVVVIGAGIGGLCAAARLAGHGVPVTVLERQPVPGGKLRTVTCDGQAIDAGPTVFTARWIFEALFADLGERLEDHLTLVPADRLARHAWSDGSGVDLWADPARSRDAIGDFAGAAEARGYDAMRREAAATWQALEHRYIEAPATTAFGLALRYAPGGFGEMLAINPFTTLWKALSRHFADPRLRQLFGRYATYCGASPFEATATLLLITHLEASGVWLVEGGMHRLALALEGLAKARGAVFRYDTEVASIRVEHRCATGVVLASGEVVPAGDIVANCDASALADGRFGTHAARAVGGLKPADRSLSALTWMFSGDAHGYVLDRHNIFFSDDYAREFAELFGQRRLPSAPSVYVCAQDRGTGPAPPGPERFQLIVNAPATGDRHPPSQEETDRCETATFALLERCGLTLSRNMMQRVGPAQFEALFPSTGGALYGRVSHGWRAAFRRPGSRTGLAGLWLAGGSAHPGAGVPMAALSGRLASAAILSARASTRTFHPAATGGGISTRKATTSAMA